MTVSRDARLASELVANLRPRADVAAAYGHSEAELVHRIRTDKGFRKILQDTKELWEADSNVKERVRAKAGLLIEDGLLDIYSILTDTSVTPNVRVQSFETLAKVANVATSGKGEDAATFKVVINLPNEEEPVSIGASIIDYEDAP